MDSAKIKETLEKLPIVPLVLAYVVYLGWDYHTFATSTDSPLFQRTEQVSKIKKENLDMQNKIRDRMAFLQSLDQKRAELRALALQLDEMKATLSDTLDVPAFMKMVITEAAKVGLIVNGLKPSAPSTKEYYVEQPFDLDFRSAYAQLVLFLERLASLERITRVDTFEIRRTGPATAPYVELGGTIQLKTYRYLGSKADDLAKKGGSPAGSGPASPNAVGGGSATPARAAPGGDGKKPGGGG